MSNQYLLPCSCGKSVSVSQTQAGDIVTCVCGTNLTVPSIRELRKLRQVESLTRPQYRVKQESNWSPLQGVLFALGLLLVVAGGGVAGYYGFWHYLSIPHATDTSKVETEMWGEKLEGMTLSETVALWDLAIKQGLGDQEVPTWKFAREVIEVLEQRWKVATVFAAIGAFMMVVSFLVGGKPKSNNPPYSAQY